MCTAALGGKGDASLASGRHHYRMNTRRDRWHYGCANDCFVYSLYYPLHFGLAARIKEHCVDNAVAQPAAVSVCSARQPEVQSKVDVLGALPAMASEAAVLAEHLLNLARSHETDQ